MQRTSVSGVVLSHREYKKYQNRGDYSKDNLQMGSQRLQVVKNHPSWSIF